MTLRVYFLLLLPMALLGMVTGCKPDLKSEDVEERTLAVQDLTDQAALAKVAVEDKDPGVRFAATARLNDKALLAKVALSESYSSDLAAYGKLDDPTILAELSATATDPTTRLNASILLKIHGACQQEVQERDRSEQCPGLLGNVAALTDPLVTAELGNVNSININSETRWQSYVGGPPIVRTGDIGNGRTRT